MRVLVELQYPNTVMDVRGFLSCPKHGRWSMHAIDITILQMRGQIGTMRIVPCVKVVLFFSS